MPLYEYECTEDGQRITLLRPMARADEPVEDPDGRGRSFTRTHSVFGVGQADAGSSPMPGGGCACGDPNGPCARG